MLPGKRSKSTRELDARLDALLALLHANLRTPLPDSATGRISKVSQRMMKQEKRKKEEKRRRKEEERKKKKKK